MIVSRKAKEASEAFDSRGAWPCLHRLDLGRVHGHASVRDDMAEVGDGRRAEGALALFDSELVLPKDED
jgi:hypothetical protein